MNDKNGGESFRHDEIAFGAFCIYEEKRRAGLHSGHEANWYEAVERLRKIRANAHDVEKWRNCGSAGMLLGAQKLLFVFVNDTGAEDWTPELRGPVESKISDAVNWLELEARKRDLALSIEFRCLPLWEGGCSAFVKIDETDPAAGPQHSTWMNFVTTRLTEFGSVSSCWDRLFELASLPLTGDEGSAIFFCVRRWVPSIAFPYFDTEHAEFWHERGIIYDNGGWTGQVHLSSLIVHELLHLYGAVDLALGKSHPATIEYAERSLDDVMHTPTQRPLVNYEIGSLTSYLIGWSEVRPIYLTHY